MMATTPKTLDAYLDLVDQAIFEIEDLLACAADEGDPDDYEFSGMLPVYEQIGRELKTLHAEILQGTHAFGKGEDLSFMPLARKWKDRLLFHDLLAALNNSHKTGF